MIDGDGMKINDVKNLLGIFATEKGRMNRGKENKIQEETENVHISGKVEMLNLLKKAKDIPEVREELVAKLKKSIESGIYKVNPERIAKKIFEEEF